MLAVKSTARRCGAIAASTALAGGVLIALSPAGPAAAADDTMTQFFYTGRVDSFQVPSGVNRIVAVGQGAQGANANNGTGGLGAKTQATLAVTPGQNLSIYVGGQGGWNGGATGGGGSLGGKTGGNGGGATDIRLTSAASSRILVAGGGGGGGGKPNVGGSGGNGGAGSQSGQSGSAGESGLCTGGSGGAGGQQSSGNGSGGGEAKTGSGGGGGGGGGGGYKGGNGGGAGGGVASGCGGGGGGGGSSFATAGSTNVTYTTGSRSGNGLLALAWIDIPTTALPHGIDGTAYAAQLESTGGTAPVTWDITNGSLPAGLAMDTAGAITGTPTAVADNTVTFRATDANGAESTVTIDMVIQPGDTRVLDAPATDIDKRSATANGTVYGRGLAITSIYCRFATTEAGVATGPQVTATPSSIGAADTSAVTCPLTGLKPNTTYFTNVFAVDSAGTHSASSAISFTTDSLGEQTANLVGGLPHHIKAKGKTVLLKRKTKTNIGQVVEVSVKQVANPARGDVTKAKFTLIRNKKGRVVIKTYGKKAFLQVTYSAGGTASYAPFTEVHVYAVGYPYK